MMMKNHHGFDGSSRKAVWAAIAASAHQRPICPRRLGGLVGLVCFGVAHAQAPLVLTDLAELIARLTRRSQLMCWVGSKARWDHLTWDIPSLERGIDGPPMQASGRTVR
jgi:hypothetical protein